MSNLKNLNKIQHSLKGIFTEGESPVFPNILLSNEDNKETLPKGCDYEIEQRSDQEVFEVFLSLNNRLGELEGNNEAIETELNNWRIQWQLTSSPEPVTVKIQHNKNSDAQGLVSYFSHKGVSRKYRWMPTDGQHVVSDDCENNTSRRSLNEFSGVGVSKYLLNETDCPQCYGKRFCTICMSNDLLNVSSDPQESLTLMTAFVGCVLQMKSNEKVPDAACISKNEYRALLDSIRPQYQVLVLAEPWKSFLQKKSLSLSRIVAGHIGRQSSYRRECKKRLAQIAARYEKEKESLSVIHDEAILVKDDEITRLKEKIQKCRDEEVSLMRCINFEDQGAALESIFVRKKQATVLSRIYQFRKAIRRTTSLRSNTERDFQKKIAAALTSCLSTLGTKSEEKIKLKKESDVLSWEGIVSNLTLIDDVSSTLKDSFESLCDEESDILYQIKTIKQSLTSRSSFTTNTLDSEGSSSSTPSSTHSRMLFEPVPKRPSGKSANLRNCSLRSSFAEFT